MSMKDLVTIVIPCKNEEDYIGFLLSDLIRQTNLHEVRIIIADAQSTDSTRDIINYYKFFLNIELIEGGSVSVGRNTGAELSTTPYILFIDADVRFFDTSVIADAVQLIHSKQLDLVTLSVKNYGKEWQATMLFQFFNICNKVMTKFTPFAVGAFFLTRQSVFHALGGFPSKYHTSEDYILSKKYHVSKFKITNGYFGQNERRFKKLGYIGMIRYIFVNFLNRNNLKHFEKTNIKYWD